MNHWPFIWSGYGLTVITTLVLIVGSFRAMLAAEKCSKGDDNEG